MSRSYYLARDQKHGFPELVDGDHDSPEGVAKAAKLMDGIFGDKGPWLMVEIHPMPDLDPEVNVSSIHTCRQLIDGEFR